MAMFGVKSLKFKCIMKNIYLSVLVLLLMSSYSCSIDNTPIAEPVSNANEQLFSKPIKIIGTRHATSTFPMFVSNPSGGMITIPSNSIYILEADPASTTIFPFYSPSSSPEIDYWTRMLSGFPNTDLPSNLVASILWRNTNT